MKLSTYTEEDLTKGTLVTNAAIAVITMGDLDPSHEAAVLGMTSALSIVSRAIGRRIVQSSRTSSSTKQSRPMQKQI